ncbi:MAG: selenocysteine lyase/cysteine desulfurase [Glaciecola sp.]|jgi:selenocysteine lyase/cysteine desulfurase
MTSRRIPPSVLGDGLDVPLIGGGSSPYVNFDFAASAPALVAVNDAVQAFLPWYSSVHRGAGYKSQLSTAAYEQARREVGRFVGAREDDVVVFTRNTTDSLNVLAAALPEDCHVVTFEGEHHANLLPWRRRTFQHLPVPLDPSLLTEVLDEALEALDDRPVLFAMTAVSNVTGEIWPVADLVATAKGHGARVVVDTAQLSPHGPVTLAKWDADWCVLSGHKLYAPYGAGALVGRRDWLEQREPFLAGGGAVAFVTHEEVLWADLPDRQEAGSPNVVGAVALGVACKTLGEHGMDIVLDHEMHLDKLMRDGLDTVPGLRRLNLWGDQHPGIAVETFELDGFHHSHVASILSAEYGIAVRDGCFCAHPLMLRLLEVPQDEADRIREEVRAGNHANVPGSVRASAGLTTTDADVDVLVEALRTIAAAGPKWTYARDQASGNWEPTNDDRPLPDLVCVPPGRVGAVHG